MIFFSSKVFNIKLLLICHMAHSGFELNRNEIPGCLGLAGGGGMLAFGIGSHKYTEKFSQKN